MEVSGDTNTKLSYVVHNLKNMFGKFIRKNESPAVVESCNGDLNLSMDAIMNMANDGNVITEEESEETAKNQNVPSIQPSCETNEPIQLSPPSRPFKILTTNQVAQPPSTNQPIQHSSPSPPLVILTRSQLARLALTSQSFQQSVTKNPTTSYASSTAQTPPYNTGAIPKTTQKVPQPIVGIWTDQIKEIITNHNGGNRTLMIMRGVPGSGKSYLARQLVDTMVGASPDCHKNHILSTDDYFMVRGQYQYDRYKLSKAHSWNQTRARNACIMGRSPVIIDNTNIELWEMEPYVREGVKNGYIIQVVEPKTPWAKEANQLVRKNLHNVPLANINRMLDNYRDGITGDILKHTYGLAYPADMVPPVKRITPPIVNENPPSKPDTIVKENTATATTSKTVANTQFIRSSASVVNDQMQQVLKIANPEQQNDYSNLNPQADKEKNTDIFLINSNDDLKNDNQVKPKLTVSKCLAKYDIIPDVATRAAGNTTSMKEKVSVAAPISQSQQKKCDVTISEGTNQMKRQIEQNVDIADNHNSKNCFKLRKIRRREPDLSENSEEHGSTELSAEAAPFVSKRISNNKAGSDDENSSKDSSLSGFEEDAMVTINLGHSFIAQLDEKFGRQNMQYPEYIVPRISIPMSRLNEINAIWMESLTCQLDEHAKKTKEMMEQDEEFARQLAMKEAGLSQAGKEQEVPDSKEIMDMDMAFSIYQKDVAAWRNNVPTDLAAKMIRDKLFNLFPDVDKDTLTELLLAHNNNFKATVEVLLSSTGRKDVLDQENGVEKFISKEEIKLKEKTTEEQRKELHEAEWPLLSRGKEVDLAKVNSYREEADKHLGRSNFNRQKAKEYLRRGKPEVAARHSELADYHKKSYEYANGMAVASLLQYHAANNRDTTIDLHYLRVKEAMESLDVFIDAHVTKLRETGNTHKQTLFFITGRGNHSQGRARIKPAAMERLKQRGIWYNLKNPGLLSAKVNHNTKLSSEISVP